MTLLLAALVIPSWAVAAQTVSSDEQTRADADGFRDFSQGVMRYVKVRDSVEAHLRRVKRADSQQNIDVHQRELANGIREARSHARRGDIFTLDASNAIRHAIKDVFKGTQGGSANATIRQGEPLRRGNLRVNRMYPDPSPYTTVPPTLLMKLPPLPDGLAYRIVERDLILLDVTASLLVDFLPQVLP